MTNLSSVSQPYENDIVHQLLADEPALLSSLDFGPCVQQGKGAGASLLIGDQSEISLLGNAAQMQLDFRMALLAQPGDLMLVRRPDKAFEDYLADYLGLSGMVFLGGDAKDIGPLAKQARRSDTAVAACVSAAAKAGGLTIQSYLTTGHVWRLARVIGQRAQCRVHVSGPSPRILRRANDKLWFAQLARQIIGRDATPPTMAAYGPAAATGLVKRLSRTSAHVVVKVPDSAGSVGNIRLQSAAIRTAPPAVLRQFLRQRLHAVGWRDTYPILVGVWDAQVTCSPSVQLWIPLAAEGPPVVDGVFEQHVRGTIGSFVGGAPSRLPQGIQTQLGHEAMQIARVLQKVGYYGRCSMDAVICQNAQPGRAIHWIECNGRWGGVSIPMTVAQRLTGGHPALSIMQDVLPKVHLDTSGLINCTQDLLLQVGHRRSGLVILSPPDAPRGASLNLLAIAQQQDDADRLIEEALARVRAL